MTSPRPPRRKPAKSAPGATPALQRESKNHREERRGPTEVAVPKPKSSPPIGDYEVGYKKSPKAHQFKNGEINNPKGRPKGRVRATDILVREASRLVRVRKGEEVITISRAEALMRTLLNKALEGDLAAARLLLPYLAQADADTLRDEMRSDNSAKDVETPIPQLDEEAVRRMLDRVSHLFTEQETP